MKRIFNLKASVLILSILLVLGLTAFATETEEVTPDIVSYNIVYGDTFKLQVAIKDETVPNGANVTVKVYDEDPTADSTVLDEFSLARTSIAQFDGAYFYVGTTNRSVAASALATEFYMQAEYTLDGETVKGNVVKYSVAEYLYEKLYFENYVAKTEADGKDYIRKTFYEGILAFGVGAQHLILDEAPEYFMNELSYAIVEDGKIGGKSTVLSNPDTELKVVYAGNKSTSLLYSWILTGLESGEVEELLVAADKTLTINAPAEAFKLTPVFKNPYVMNFENGALTDEAKTLSITNTPGSGITASITTSPTDAANSVYQLVGTPSSNQHFRVGFASGTNTTGNTYTFETEMYISSTDVNGNMVPSNTKFGSIDFRNGHVYGVNLYYNASSNGVNVRSNVKENNEYRNIASLPYDTWFTFKLVVVTSTVNGVNDFDAFFYVNDKLAGKQEGLSKFGDSTASVLDAKDVNIKLEKNIPVKMYLDDLTFTRTQIDE